MLYPNNLKNGVLGSAKASGSNLPETTPYCNPEAKGALLLLPNLLGPHPHPEVFLPASVAKAVASLDGLIAESVGEGRRYLGYFEIAVKAHEMPLALYEGKTDLKELDFLLEPIVK